MKTVFFFLSWVSLIATAQTVAPSDRARIAEKNGCQPATEFLRVAEIYAMSGGDADAANYRRELQTVRAKACRGDFARTDAIVYSNGTTATSAAGDSTASWYWPNGNLIISTALNDTSSVYYPNGNTVSTSFRTAGTTFNYPDGRTMTSTAGTPNSALNDMNGNTLGVPSPDFTKGADRLDTSRFLSHVIDTNSGVAPDLRNAECSPDSVDQRLDKTLGLLQDAKNLLAAQEIGALRACL